jgi:hypothetical protein
MTILKSLFVITLLATGALVFDTPAALPRVVCDEWGNCWRVHGHLHSYYPGWGWNYEPYQSYQWRRQDDGEGYGGWGEQEGPGRRAGHWEED